MKNKYKRNNKKKANLFTFKIILIFITILIEIACTSPIKQASKTIKKNPGNNVVVAVAVNQIWELLNKDFPKDNYACNWAYPEFMDSLPKAICGRVPFIVTFAPKCVKIDRDNYWNQRWHWTTTFIELAGKEVTLTNMVPYISTPEGNHWTYNTLNKDYFDVGGVQVFDIGINAYGKAFYDWSCSGAYDGSLVQLLFRAIDSPFRIIGPPEYSKSTYEVSSFTSLE